MPLNEYLENQIREIVTGLTDSMLEVEFSDLLCQKKYQRLKEIQSKRYYRNGYRKRYLLTLYCMLLQVRIPRCRGIGICIKELPRWQRSEHSRSKKTELLRSLRKRGLSSDKTTVVVHDGEGSIRLAIKNVYGKGNIPEQECMFHKLIIISKSVENKLNETLFKNDLWNVYSSETKEEYRKNKTEFIRKWITEEPKGIKLFCISDDKLTTKYDFDIEMHKSIHTNNPIERYFRKLRRRIKAIGIFETISSADRLLFLMIDSINQRRGSLPSFPNLKFTH